MSDALKVAIVSGAFAIGSAVISEWMRRRTQRKADRHPRRREVEGRGAPGWVSAVIIGVTLTIVTAQAFTPLVTDRQVVIPPLLYVLAAGAVAYYVAQTIAGQDDHDGDDHDDV
ncbi:MAG: hypothetical protein ACTHMP_15095 [Thermomicrobiales bacterium]